MHNILCFSLPHTYILQSNLFVSTASWKSIIVFTQKQEKKKWDGKKNAKFATEYTRKEKNMQFIGCLLKWNFGSCKLVLFCFLNKFSPGPQSSPPAPFLQFPLSTHTSIPRRPFWRQKSTIICAASLAPKSLFSFFPLLAAIFLKKCREFLQLSCRKTA